MKYVKYMMSMSVKIIAKLRKHYPGAKALELTIPSSVINKLGLKEGDFVEVIITRKVG